MVLVTVITVVVLLLLPVTSGTGGPRTREGGRLREAVVGSATRIHPLDARSTPAERDLAMLIYAGLTRPGPDGRPLPALAESWVASADARVFTFRLRNGLTWHDGHEVVVEDVLFTISALVAMGDRADPALQEVWRSATVRQDGEDAIRVELPRPFAALPAYASFGVLPAHRFAGVAAADSATEDFFRAPTGAGPFRLVELRGDRARLQRFTGYALGVPYLDEIELRFYATPAEAQGAVARGEAASVVLRRAEAVPGAIAHTLAAPLYTAVLLNHRSPLFVDAAVRRALSVALDRERLAVDFGGIPTDVPFVPGWWAASGSGGPRPVMDAAALLAGAGWVRGSDGIARKDGRELAFTLVFPADGRRGELAQAIAAAWRAVGVRVTIAPTEPERLLTDFLLPRTYEAAIAGIDPGSDPDPMLAWHSSFAGSREGNLGDVIDPILDELASAARTTAGVDARHDLYGSFTTRFRELVPGIVLLGESATYLIAPALAGFEQVAITDPSWRFAGVHRWRLAGPR